VESLDSSSSVGERKIMNHFVVKALPLIWFACSRAGLRGVFCFFSILYQRQTEQHDDRAEGSVDFQQEKPAAPMGEQRFRPNL
jgi:hypothetical protein